MHQLADRSSPDHVSGSYSLLVQIYLKYIQLPVPLIMLERQPKWASPQLWGIKTSICKPLKTSAKKKSIKRRSYYNASNENLQKFVNLHTWVEEKKKKIHTKLCWTSHKIPAHGCWRIEAAQTWTRTDVSTSEIRAECFMQLISDFDFVSCRQEPISSVLSAASDSCKMVQAAWRGTALSSSDSSKKRTKGGTGAHLHIFSIV